MLTRRGEKRALRPRIGTCKVIPGADESMQGTGSSSERLWLSKGVEEGWPRKVRGWEGDRTRPYGGSGRIWSRGGVIGSVVTPGRTAAELAGGRQGAGLEVSTRNPGER